MFRAPVNTGLTVHENNWTLKLPNNIQFTEVAEWVFCQSRKFDEETRSIAWTLWGDSLLLVVFTI